MRHVVDHPAAPAGSPRGVWGNPNLPPRDLFADAYSGQLLVARRHSPSVIFAVLVFVAVESSLATRRHVHRRAEGRPAAGPLDGTSGVVVEEIWKLVGRKATGAWLVELAKRARHIGLWRIAITQQRSDLASPDGRALLDNSTIQLFLRNGPDDVAHVADALHLSAEEVAQITRLVTEKHSHAEAYLVNGERGRGGITIRLGSRAYWLATSDPVAVARARAGARRRS